MNSDDIDLSEYPDIEKNSFNFPKTIHIAYAVCKKECGVREFIVDGSTQRCQKCGSLMFRTDVSKYLLDSNL